MLSPFSPGDPIASHRVGTTIEVYAPEQLGNGESEIAVLAQTFGSLYDSIGNLGIEVMELLLAPLGKSVTSQKPNNGELPCSKCL